MSKQLTTKQELEHFDAANAQAFEIIDGLFDKCDDPGLAMSVAHALWVHLGYVLADAGCWSEEELQSDLTWHGNNRRIKDNH